MKATACSRLDSELGLSASQVSALPFRPHCPPMVIRLDLYNYLAKGTFIPCTDGETEAQRGGHIVASLLHLEAAVQSPGVAFVPSGHGLTWAASRAHRGCSEHGLARGPSALLA